MHKSDRNLQQLYKDFETVITIPARDNFLCDTPPTSKWQTFYLIDPWHTLHFWFSPWSASQYSTIKDYTSNITSLLDMHHFPEEKAYAAWVRHDYHTPYFSQLCSTAQILYHAKECPSKEALEIFTSHTPLALSPLFDNEKIIKLTVDKKTTFSSLCPKRFFKDFALQTPESSHYSTKWDMNFKESILWNIFIEEIIKNNDFSSTQALFKKLKTRHWLVSTEQKYTKAKLVHRKDFTTKKSLITWLSYYTKQRPPLFSQSLNSQTFCSHSPSLLIRQYKNKKVHPYNWSYQDAINTWWIVIDTVTGKLYIDGNKFNSTHLPSQKFLTEILPALISAPDTLNNTQLPSSSYAKNKNTFESKISLPFNKLIRKFWYQKTSIFSQWPLYEFTVGLKQQWVVVTLIQQTH